MIQNPVNADADNSRNPVHIGIIMDGNGRWARNKGKIRTQGHLEGLKTAKSIVNAAVDLGISYLTLYTFSTENWKRPKDEVGFIMSLVKQYLREELDFYAKNRIRIRHTGSRDELPTEILKELDFACENTRDFNGLQVILALNYGGRNEIIRAVNKIIQAKIVSNENNDEINLDEEYIRKYLDNPDVPDPDLIIRTAGEFRTSNFLLWQGAYAEYIISDKLWPDWEPMDLINAVNEYKNRDRRFGGAK